jgi:hypothetical protein
MDQLKRNEQSLLELLAIEPLSMVPPIHRSLVDRLAERGLTMKQGARLYVTAAGLRFVGRVLH